MRTNDRLDRVERARTPVEVVTAWLETAHTWGSRESFGFALLDPRHANLGFGRALEDLTGGTRRAATGPMAERHRRVVKAYRHAVFLHELVGLIDGAIAGSARDIGREAEWLARSLGPLFPDERGPIDRRRAEAWLGGVSALTRAHVALGDAVRTAELRYLEGFEAAFPDSRARRATTTATLEDVRVLGDAIVEHHLGLGAAPEWDPTDAMVAAWFESLEVAARIEAHLSLGETERALELLGPAPEPAATPDATCVPARPE